MANIVGNDLRVVGSKAELQKLLKDIKDHVQYDEEFDFNFIVQMPPHQPDVSKPNSFWRGDIGNEEYEKYGTNNERDWALDNWGSKWGAYSSSLGSISTHKFPPEVSIFFNTAYTAAEDVIQLMSEKYPTLTIFYSYTTEDYSGAKMKFLGGEWLDEQYSEDIRNDEDWDNDEDNLEPRIDLSNATEGQKSDKDFVLKVLSYNGFDLEYASEILRDDEEVVTMAFENATDSFQCASDRLKDNREFVSKLIQRDASALTYATERLQSDKELIQLTRSDYKDANDALAFLLVQKEFVTQVNPLNLIRRLSGGIIGFYRVVFGFKKGIEFQWPFGFRDYTQIDYFKTGQVQSVIPFQFVDFNWINVEQYHLVKVRFVYYTTNEPLPNSKIYDGHTGYFLVPYKLSPGDRVLDQGRHSVLVEEVFAISDEKLNQPITTLPVTKIIINNLTSAGLVTLKDILDYDSDDFTSIKGMGSRSNKTYKELETALLTLNIGLAKARSQVVESSIKMISSQEAYNQAKAINVSDINWIKFSELHNDDTFFVLDLSRYDLTTIEKIAEDELKNLEKNEIIKNSTNYEKLVNLMDELDNENIFVYLAYLQKEWSYRKIDDEYEDEDLDEEEYL